MHLAFPCAVAFVCMALTTNWCGADMVKFETLRNGDWFYLGNVLHIKVQRTLTAEEHGDSYSYVNAVDANTGKLVYVLSDDLVSA